MPQRVEQRGYSQRRSYDPELGFLTRERPEELLKEHHATQVHSYEHCCERAVDEGAVYEDVYVVEPVAQDRDAHRNRQAHDTGYHQHGAAPSQPNYTHRCGDYIGEDGACGQRRHSVSEPLDLLALYPLRVP